MQIDVSYDSSVNSAPAAFVTDVNIAVEYLESLFTNPITISIDVGYGEIDGQPLESGALGESEPAINGQADTVYSEPYSAVANALIAENAPGSSTLPAASPLSGDVYVWSAEAKALGLVANDSGIDGYVGFSSGNSFSYADNVTPPSNEYYFIGVVEHEITEDMGRVSLLDDQPNDYTPLDLFRYSSPGVRDTATGGSGSTAYFSINGGTTDLGSWNNDPSNGDLADWYPQGPAPGGDDAFNDYADPGVINVVSQNDVTVMEALGYTVNNTEVTQPTWTEIGSAASAALVGGDFEGLGSAQLVASETGAGTYIYVPSTTTWTKIDGGVPTILAEGDLYGTLNGNNNNSDVAAYFPGYGTYTWQNSYGWTKIDTRSVTALTTGIFNGGTTADIAAAFSGGGVYLWSASSGWNEIDNGAPTLLATGDVYGSGNGNNNDADLVAYYPGYGTYIWGANTGWNKIDGGAATEYATGNFLGTADGNNNQSDLAAYFPGYGTYIWSQSAGWQKIDSGDAAGLAGVDLSGNGQNELLAYFQNYGMYEWQEGVGWNKYDNTSALPTSAQQALFATGNFQGGSAVDAAVTFPGQGGVWLDPPSTLADAASANTSGPISSADTANLPLFGQAIASSFAPPSATSSPALFNTAELMADQTASLARPGPGA